MAKTEWFILHFRRRKGYLLTPSGRRLIWVQSSFSQGKNGVHMSFCKSPCFRVGGPHLCRELEDRRDERVR